MSGVSDGSPPLNHWRSLPGWIDGYEPRRSEYRWQDAAKTIPAAATDNPTGVLQSVLRQPNRDLTATGSNRPLVAAAGGIITSSAGRCLSALDWGGGTVQTLIVCMRAERLNISAPQYARWVSFSSDTNADFYTDGFSVEESAANTIAVDGGAGTIKITTPLTFGNGITYNWIFVERNRGGASGVQTTQIWRDGVLIAGNTFATSQKISLERMGLGAYLMPAPSSSLCSNLRIERLHILASANSDMVLTTDEIARINTLLGAAL